MRRPGKEFKKSKIRGAWHRHASLPEDRAESGINETLQLQANTPDTRPGRSMARQIVSPACLRPAYIFQGQDRRLSLRLPLQAPAHGADMAKPQQDFQGTQQLTSISYCFAGLNHTEPTSSHSMSWRNPSRPMRPSPNCGKAKVTPPLHKALVKHRLVRLRAS